MEKLTSKPLDRRYNKSVMKLLLNIYISFRCIDARVSSIVAIRDVPIDQAMTNGNDKNFQGSILTGSWILVLLSLD